jgi:Ala-tRNA(Pro) deacylase
MAIVEELLFESYLRTKGAPFDVIFHAEADDSIEKSGILDVPSYGVLKALLIKGTFGEAVAVLPASRRIDHRLLAEITGDPHVRLASEEELDWEYSSIELGALPPLGRIYGLPTYVDATVIEHDVVVVASGRRDESLMLKTADLFADEDVIGGLFSNPLNDDQEPAPTFG